MNKKATIVLALLAITAALVYWKRDWIKSKVMGVMIRQQISTVNDKFVPAESESQQYVECTSYPIKKGCKGKHVETIQKLLNHLHNSGLDVDGYFGDSTEEALDENGYGKTFEKGDYLLMKDRLNSQ